MPLTGNQWVRYLILIGMLHHRKDPQTVQKSYAYAAVAKTEGAQLLYFSPRHVNFEERKINGYIYEDGNWQKVESPFPDVINNTGTPEKLEKSIDTIKLIGTESNVFSFDEMRDFVSDRIRQELYLVQPYINCKTKEGIAYDIRLHVQKNGDGNQNL